MVGYAITRVAQAALLTIAVLATCGRVRGEDPLRTTNAKSTQSSTLTSALAVHQLPLSAAAQAYPVLLHCVVTYYDPVEHLLFVQDRSDGIFVELEGEWNLPLKAGDDVEIRGVSSAGFAPNVSNARIRVLGHGGLPAPKSGSFESAIRGREDCRWLELSGIVQGVAKRNSDTLLTLAFGANTYEAYVPAPPEALTHLVDAEVTLRGACGALFNSRNQLLGIRMFLPGADCIRVVRPPARDPFRMPPTAIADLLRFSNERELGHLVRVRGTLTYLGQSGPAWVQDASGGAMLQDHDAAGLAMGDLVDVAGFPAIAGFGPALRGAQVKRVQAGVPPLPRRITVPDAMSGAADGELIRIEGTLVERLGHPGEQTLVVKAGDTTFDANLPAGEMLASWEPGMRLRLTGICSVEVQQSHDWIWPRKFRLLLRSPADVEILSRPPWFTARRMIPILIGALLVMVASLGWIGLLRRRVRTQTDVLRAQTVQLQAAHIGTRQALEKAREAESLDEDSRHIVELIARDEPVDLIVDRIAEAVALHCEGAFCAILLAAPDVSRVCAVPAMPSGWLEVLGSIDIRSITCSAEPRPAKEFSDDPAWAEFGGTQQGARFGTFFSAPILVYSATVGVIAAFFRNEPDVKGGQLGLWCNIAALALERRTMHDQLAYRAQHDSLTGLPNRAMLEEELEAEIERAARRKGLLGILYIDLDGFKQINDTYGHDAGDTVLRETANRMSQGTRRGDTVARIGGDEFVVLLPQLARREDAGPIADKIAKMLREPIYAKQERVFVNASVGIAIWPLDGDRPDPLLRFADAQMYAAKRRRQKPDPSATLADQTLPVGADQPLGHF
jgi:diguanylate cyclase (GGDEF)-like protein